VLFAAIRFARPSNSTKERGSFFSSRSHTALGFQRLHRSAIVGPSDCVTPVGHRRTPTRSRGCDGCLRHRVAIMSWCHTDAVSWAAQADALAQAPDLPGARCAGRWDLFDLQPGHSSERGPVRSVN
jgi:hypothetical protein